MKSRLDTQELVHRFNEDEAVWRYFERRRGMRDPFSPIPEEIQDQLDWREAEQEVRQTRAVGKPLISDLCSLTSDL